MKKITISLIALLIGTFLVVPSVYANPVNPFEPCTGINDSAVCTAAQGGGKLFGPNSLWNRILNVLTMIIGAVAVLMIVIGGLRYGISAGDAQQVSSAKNTIIYALVALVISVMANAIVNFVLTQI